MGSINLIKILIFVIFINSNFTQELLDRLIVPIDYQINFSTGYDSNLFLFSNDFQSNKVVESQILDDIKFYDSDYYKTNIKLIYSPVISYQGETNFILKVQNKIYRTFHKKNTLSTNLKFEKKFSSYNWLKAGYYFSPHNYLRRYKDLDLHSEDYFDCTYSNSKLFLSYSFPLTKNTWSRLTWSSSKLYYNKHFAEFDTHTNNFKWYFSHKLNKKVNYSMNIGYEIGNNISFEDGLPSTEINRSYESKFLKISRSHYNINSININKLYVSFSTDLRNYISESLYDPLHNGRYHFDYQLYVSIRKRIKSSFSTNLFFKFRKRQTISEFEWVQDLKSFNKFEMGVKFTFNGVYDIYR